MIHAEQIIRAAGALVYREDKRVFTREEIRERIGVDREEWNASYSPTFQAMRIDQPGGAPPIGDRWRGVFRRVEHGRYVLTERGRELWQELEAAAKGTVAFRREASRDLRGQLAAGEPQPPPGITIRPFAEADFAAIQRLSAAEGWPTPVERPREALAAWQRSFPALVAVEGEQVIGFLRALSDCTVTTYVCELLVALKYRNRGIGHVLLEECRCQVPATRLDLLSTSAADGFYEAQGFRRFQGFRKSRDE